MTKTWADDEERKRWLAHRSEMNKDEILERHGIKPDKSVLTPSESKTQGIVDYAIIDGDTFDGHEVGELCVDILAYYYDPGVFLVERKQDDKYPEYFYPEG